MKVKLEIWGNAIGSDGGSEIPPIQLEEVCFCGTTKQLRKIGKFLLESADSLENGEHGWHCHYKSKVTDKPDVVAVLITENKENAL